MKKDEDLFDIFDKASKNLQDPNFLNSASANHYVNNKDDKFWPRTPGSSNTGSDYDGLYKPDGKSWDVAPVTESDKQLYFGVHIHNERNPLGLHSHVPGGNPGGQHSHGPVNRMGVHTHKEIQPGDMGLTVDGEHVHSQNHPDGGHEHRASTFG